MPTKKIFLLLLCLLTVIISGCGKNKELAETELAALNEIFSQNYAAKDYTNISQEVMSGERQEKFKAVKMVLTTPEGDYAFISKPVAYNGPVTLALGIDKESGTTIGMRIVEHEETLHYVRDMDKSWFTDRFAGKSVDSYLEPVHLESSRDNQVVIITGATVTTEGISNGVNACLGLFRESVHGEEAEAVPYMVNFAREEGEGPEENGKIAVRSYGVVVGEVALEDIKKMPSVKRTMSIHSTAGTSKHSFRGTLLSNVIAAVDPALLESCESLQLVGVDDYMSNISMEEVLAENSVYLMYEDNGKALSNKNGQAGAMRVVVLDDVFGQRFTNYMIEIVLE